MDMWGVKYASRRSRIGDFSGDSSVRGARVLSTFLIQQTGLERTQAKTGAVTLIQRFGSAANLNIHLHCLVLDGVYHTPEGLPVFHAVRAPTAEELQSLLARIIKRLMNRMHRDVQL